MPLCVVCFRRRERVEMLWRENVRLFKKMYNFFCKSWLAFTTVVHKHFSHFSDRNQLRCLCFLLADTTNEQHRFEQVNTTINTNKKWTVDTDPFRTIVFDLLWRNNKIRNTHTTHVITSVAVVKVFRKQIIYKRENIQVYGTCIAAIHVKN